MAGIKSLVAVALLVLFTVVSSDPVTDRWNLNYPTDQNYSPFWRLLCKTRPVYTGRLDPIISPGGYSGHVHKVFGSSGFTASYNGQDHLSYYNQLVNAKCTSCNINKLDMSAYWHPELYYRNPTTGLLEIVKGEGLTVYYLSRRGGNPQWWIPFPKGFRMIAGDQGRRSFDPNNMAHKAITYACYKGDGFSGTDKEANGFPGYGNKNVGCSAIRLQIFFPTCWNGKDLDVPDHHTHMAYPIGDISQGDCPTTHPYRVPGIFFEAFYNTNLYPHGDGVHEWPFVLAQSDLTGYGMHADFVSGWDEDALHKALHDQSCNCGNVDCCNTFKPFHQGAGLECPQDKPNGWFEDVGMTTPIKKLPGCSNFTGIGANAPNCVTPSPALTDASTGVHRVFIASANKGILTPPWNEPWDKVTIDRKELDLDNVWSVVSVPGQKDVVLFQNLYSKGFLVHWVDAKVYSMQQNVNDAFKNNWYWWKVHSQSNGLSTIVSVRDNSSLTYDVNDLSVSARSVKNITSAQLWSYSDKTRWTGTLPTPTPSDDFSAGSYRIKQASTGQYISTNGNDVVLSTSGTVFKVSQASNGWSFLSTQNNKFVCADSNGSNNLIANRDNASGWETFTIDSGNGGRTIKAVNNKFVAVQSDGHVKATASAADNDSTWTFESA